MIRINKILNIANLYDNFNRCDVAVIYSSIKDFLSGEETAFKLYKKMQFIKTQCFISRYGKEKGSEYLKINLNHGIENIKKYIRVFRDKTTEGMLRFSRGHKTSDEIDYTNIENRPIMVGDNGILNNGSHRLATAVYFDYEKLPSIVVPISSNFHPAYTIDWFEKRDFSVEEIKKIMQIVEEIRQRRKRWEV